MTPALVFTTTAPELNYWLKGKNKLCDYLVENTIHEAALMEDATCWSRVIWDVCAAAWLLNDGGRFMSSTLIHAPIPEYDRKYAFDEQRHLMRRVTHVWRDNLFNALFDTLRK